MIEKIIEKMLINKIYFAESSIIGKIFKSKNIPEILLTQKIALKYAKFDELAKKL